MPNGYGSIYKLSGNRRKPWVVRKTTGWKEETVTRKLDSQDGKDINKEIKVKKQLYYTIGYYESRPKALAALAEYNKNPIAERGDITLKELYDKWSIKKYENIAKKTAESYRTAWNYLGTLGNMKFKEIRKDDMQNIIDKMYDDGMSQSSYGKVKTLAGLLYKSALENDVVSKNYAQFIDAPYKEVGEKESFNDLEIKVIEEYAKVNEWANTVLILIYTGMRIGELLALTKFNVDIDNMIITGGAKTEAGKNRPIPINPKIQKYMKEWYEKNGETLICRNGKGIKIKYYRDYLYYPAIEKIKVGDSTIRRLNPHCTRHTFGSLLARAGVDPLLIQKLIGHADYATTANIYTHSNIKDLKQAIEKI
jgi:integrase